MIVPLVGESEWRAVLDEQPLWQPPSLHTLVVAPHPDDETLGAGGLIASLRSRGVPVTIVAVTDGENAYADFPELAQVRTQEQNRASACLGVDHAQIHRLHLVDSEVGASEERLYDSLLPLVTHRTHVIAPWQGDFHPDHEACGRVAEAIAELKNVPLTSYFFWTWHRGTLQSTRNLSLVKFPLTQEQQGRKTEALNCHVSQLVHYISAPILPENLLEPARRPYETFLPS